MPGHCARPCAAPADCCPQPGCDTTVYPNNYTCENGACVTAQCTSDTDCAGEVCKAVHGLKACVLPCTAPGDCSGIATCEGVADDASKYCAVVEPPCANNAECGPGGACINTKCGCADASYCGGAGKCDATTGACYCDDGQDCASHPFATYCAH